MTQLCGLRLVKWRLKFLKIQENNKNSNLHPAAFPDDFFWVWSWFLCSPLSHYYDYIRLNKNFLNSASVARSPRSRSHCGSLGSQKFWNGPPGRELGFENWKWLEIDCISFVDIQSIGTSLKYSFWLLQIEFGDFQPLNYIGSPNSLIWTWLCLVNFGPWLDFIGTWNLDSNLIFFTYIQCRLHKKLEMNCVSCRKRIVPFQFGEWQD